MHLECIGRQVAPAAEPRERPPPTSAFATAITILAPSLAMPLASALRPTMKPLTCTGMHYKGWHGVHSQHGGGMAVWARTLDACSTGTGRMAPAKWHRHGTGTGKISTLQTADVHPLPCSHFMHRRHP